MVVTNRVLEQVDVSLLPVSLLVARADDLLQTLLSPGGAFYLVTIPQNKPFDIIEQMKARGLTGEVSYCVTLECHA